MRPIPFNVVGFGGGGGGLSVIDVNYSSPGFSTFDQQSFNGRSTLEAGLDPCGP